MTAATIERVDVRRQVADSVAELRDAHLEAAAIIADLDLDDAAQWRHVDGLVAELTAAAYRLTAAVTCEPQHMTATNVPPVVRVREMAMAQRQLFSVLNGPFVPAHDLVEEDVRRIRRLGQLLWA